MNRERSESERQLLNDVLREGEGTGQAALAAFRRARFVRKVTRVSAVLALIIAVTGLLIWQHDPNRNSRIAAGPRDSSVSRQPQGEPTEHDVPTLTDEQLLASFPPNSCFLAEVDGRQILVFTDPAIEQQVLRSAGLGKAYQTH